MNHKKLFRVYQEAGLSVRRKKRKPAGQRSIDLERQALPREGIHDRQDPNRSSACQIVVHEVES